MNGHAIGDSTREKWARLLTQDFTLTLPLSLPQPPTEKNSLPQSSSSNENEEKGDEDEEVVEEVRRIVGIMSMRMECSRLLEWLNKGGRGDENQLSQVPHPLLLENPCFSIKCEPHEDCLLVDWNSKSVFASPFKWSLFSHLDGSSPQEVAELNVAAKLHFKGDRVKSAQYFLNFTEFQEMVSHLMEQRDEQQQEQEGIMKEEKNVEP